MVKKPEDDYSKPRKFRDRRDKEKISSKREAPKNPPYEREHKNWTRAAEESLQTTLEENLQLLDMIKDDTPEDVIDRMWAGTMTEDDLNNEDSEGS